LPIYEYYCDDCDKSYEVTQKITDKRLEQCPVCNSPRVRKLVSLSSFHLKGTGWYVTDYAKKDAKNGNGANGEHNKAKPASDSAEAKNAGDDSSKSEAKPNSESKSSAKPDSMPKSSAKPDSTSKSEGKSDRASNSST
jgi:putative FmdB family regulatory protein